MDLLRFDNEQVQKSHAMIQDQVGSHDEEYRVKKLLEQQERRRLLGTSDLVNEIQEEEEDEDDHEDVEKKVDIDEDINTFNQPAAVQNINDIYQKALEQQVGTDEYLFDLSLVFFRLNRSSKETSCPWSMNNPKSIIGKFLPRGMSTRIREAMSHVLNHRKSMITVCWVWLHFTSS